MEKYWADRKSEWFRGGYVCVNELMERYYLWEKEPMCDSFNKCVESTGKWNITVYRSYINPDGKAVAICHEHFAEADDLTKEVVMELYKKIMTSKYRLPEIREMLETAKYEAEALEYMP